MSNQVASAFSPGAKTSTVDQDKSANDVLAGISHDHACHSRVDLMHGQVDRRLTKLYHHCRHQPQVGKQRFTQLRGKGISLHSQRVESVKMDACK